MIKTFTPENDIELTTQKLRKLFDALPNYFFESEGIEPSAVSLEAIKHAAKKMIAEDLLLERK